MTVRGVTDMLRGIAGASGVRYALASDATAADRAAADPVDEYGNPAPYSATVVILPDDTARLLGSYIERSFAYRRGA